VKGGETSSAELRTGNAERGTGSGSRRDRAEGFLQPSQTRINVLHHPRNSAPQRALGVILRYSEGSRPWQLYSLDPSEYLRMTLLDLQR
jgi:hypothetical protein